MSETENQKMPWENDPIIGKAGSGFKGLDKDTGAPAKVRFLVGSAPAQDRLATLRQFFPDAQPYDGDNFIFTSPSTGRPTVYNPGGLDRGDVASVASEAGEFVGGTVGGALAAPMGGVGALAGMGAGAAAGKELVDAVARQMGTVDTRTAAEHAIDTGITAGINAVAPKAGELIGQGAKKLVGGMRTRAVGATPAELYDDFRQLGVDATAGNISQSPVLQAVESVIGKTPGGASIIQEGRERALDQVAAATSKIADDFASRTVPGSTAPSQQTAGAVLKDAAKEAADRFTTTQTKLYDDAFGKIGSDTPVSLENVKALRESFEAKLAAAPEALKGTHRSPYYEAAIGELQRLENDAAIGLPFDALRQVRTKLGQELADPVLVGSTGAYNDLRRQMYGALTADMSRTAANVSPEAAKSLAFADRYTRRLMNDKLSTSIPNTLGKITNAPTDEQAFNWAFGGAKDGGSRLKALRNHLIHKDANGAINSQAWDNLAGSILGRMGRATPGANGAAGDVFSPATFLTNWNKLSKEAKEALFGGTRYSSLKEPLDRLARVNASLKMTAKEANHSNTATHLYYQSLMMTLGGGVGALASDGDASGIASGIGFGVVAPWVAAKLITRPSFVRWLAEAPQAASQGKISQHLGRLTAIGKLEPTIKNEIAEFRSQFDAHKRENDK